MSSDSGSNDGVAPGANSEASHDALGDTQLGRSLKELIKEIGKEKEAMQRDLAAAAPSGSGSQDVDDFDPSQTRFDRALELAAANPDAEQARPNGADSEQSGHSAPLPAAPADAEQLRGADADPEMAAAMTGMAALLQRFADAERRRSEKAIAEWKVQLKKATMIVIKKQVDTARAKWMQNLSANEARIAEHYRRLKALADKVAKQKAQIQQAKKELEKKLEVADRLHSEFDEIRHVLDGQIDAIDALDDNDEPAES